VERQDQGRILGDAKIVATDLDAGFSILAISSASAQGDDHAVADDRGLAPAPRLRKQR
jgi:hypothetical protein